MKKFFKFLALPLVFICSISLAAINTISSPHNFDSMSDGWHQMLIIAHDNPHLKIIWSGYGGFVDLMEQVVAQLRSMPTVKIQTTGMSASAHAMALCQLPTSQVDITKGTQLLFHTMAVNGKRVYPPEQVSMFKACQAAGYITPEAVDAVLNKQKIAIMVFGDNEKIEKIIYQDDTRPADTSLDILEEIVYN